jgi:hypothetical protein
MRQMILLLIAFMQLAQVVFRTADLIIGRPIQSLLGWLAAPSRMMVVTTSRALVNGSMVILQRRFR